MAVLKAPLAMAPLEPHECVVPELFCVLSTEAIPAPGDAVAVPTLLVDGAGEAVLNPVGNVHCAIVKPQTGVGPAGAVFTVSVSVAKLPVSTVPTKR